jgi:hypothetical protein
MTRFRYYLLLCGLLIVGIAAASIDLPGMPKRERLVHTLADALLIGSVLALTVDAYLKKWLLKEAALDVFQFMLGFQLPRGVTDRIKTLVESAALIRRDCELRWTLEWADEKKETVRIRLEVSYFMENSSHEDKKYQQRTSGLNPNDPKARVEEMWFHSSEPEKDYHLKDTDLTCLPEDAAGNRWCVAPPTVIPSRNRERDLERKFGARYYSENKAQDNDIYVFTDLTLNVRVVVEAPADLNIKVDPEADRRHLGDSYEYSRLFVDNESVTLHWSRKIPSN